MPERKSRNPKRPRAKKAEPKRDRSRDQEERRTNRIRLTQIAVEVVRTAWEIGIRLWR